jgi:hypothetical protein
MVPPDCCGPSRATPVLFGGAVGIDYLVCPGGGGCIYDSEGKFDAYNIFQPGHHYVFNDQHGTPVYVEHYQNREGLIKEAIFYTDGYQRNWDRQTDMWVSKPIKTPLPAPYQDGYSNAHFESGPLVEFGSISYPSSFLLQVFSMKSPASAATDLETIVTVEAEIHSVVEPSSEAIPLPEVASGMMVREERFVWDQDFQVFEFYYQTDGA